MRARVSSSSFPTNINDICRSVSFIDLAGHEKYMKTALHGMVGRAPQFCLLVISAVAGTRYYTLPAFVLLTCSDIIVTGLVGLLATSQGSISLWHRR